jgi:hypothetical protein
MLDGPPTREDETTEPLPVTIELLDSLLCPSTDDDDEDDDDEDDDDD